MWYDELHLDIDVETGEWDGSIKIKKTIDYACSDCDNFLLTITVWNDGPTDLSNVVVQDSIGLDAIPDQGSSNPSHGTINWINSNDFIWTIGDLLIDDIATLTIEISITCSGGGQYASIIVDPENGETISVPRYYHNTGTTGLGWYTVEHKYDSRAVRLENIEPNLGNGGNVETDTFTITVLGGTNTVDVTTKAGSEPPEGETTTINVGETITGPILGFTIYFVSVDDIGGGLKEYTFDVTSDDQQSTKALSHIDFDFGYYTSECNIEVNEGAMVSAYVSDICGTLEATTESITISIDNEGNVDPPLPYSTPWAEDFCECCNCE